MSEFFGTGIDTDYLTIFLAIVVIIISTSLPLILYHLSKDRAKLTFKNWDTARVENDIAHIVFECYNYGKMTAINTEIIVTSLNKEKCIIQNTFRNVDILPLDSETLSIDFPLKEKDHCKILFKIFWNNTTNILKKDNNSKIYLIVYRGTERELHTEILSALDRFMYFMKIYKIKNRYPPKDIG